MKIFALVEPDYDGCEIIGLFSSREKAEAALEKGFWRPETFEIREYLLDIEVDLKFEPFYSHTINQKTDYGVSAHLRAHNSPDEIPNEHVWYSDETGLQARGLGRTPEDATNQAKRLMGLYESATVLSSNIPLATIPRPDLIVRKS